MKIPRFLLAGLALCLLLAALPVWAVGTPVPPAPTRWVTDEAGFLSSPVRAQLDKRLEAYEKANKHQIIVWIGKTTGGVPIEDWAVRAFKEWKVGRKGIDDGVVLFIMAEDRKLRIEVGYGLEGTVPDATASRIINDHIVPAIRAGDRDGAVTAGVDELLAAIGGADPGRGDSQRRLADSRSGVDHTVYPGGELGILQKIFFGIIALLVLAFVITHPSLAFWLLLNIATSGRSSGGFGGGGGGFSGGGGRSGGGGASGSW